MTPDPSPAHIPQDDREGEAGADPGAAEWRKSSRSGDGDGRCAEVAEVTANPRGAVAVRDGKRFVTARIPAAPNRFSSMPNGDSSSAVSEPVSSAAAVAAAGRKRSSGQGKWFGRDRDDELLVLPTGS
ncbi:DUF397 domain-containing protein [Streptosporangium sp. NPDC051022]|uniref:DUF397 domain-containing protein n=1 Tax=Streptosporangium sp. NPDC051022 TaxID=3155752 RepID=UPI00343EAC26